MCTIICGQFSAKATGKDITKHVSPRKPKLCARKNRESRCESLQGLEPNRYPVFDAAQMYPVLDSVLDAMLSCSEVVCLLPMFDVGVSIKSFAGLCNCQRELPQTHTHTHIHTLTRQHTHTLHVMLIVSNADFLFFSGDFSLKLRVPLQFGLIWRPMWRVSSVHLGQWIFASCTIVTLLQWIPTDAWCALSSSEA